MKKSKLKILFSTLALTTLVTTVPLTIVSCSSNKSTSNDNVNKPVEPSNPDIPSVTPPNKDEISSVGGEYNGLNVSSYLDVIKTLNLSSNTNIVELNDNSLNNILHQTYPQFNISIQNGSSEYAGQLNLKLTNNQTKEIIDENIVIKGFSVNKYSKFSVIKAEISLQNWFYSFQPIMNQNSNNVSQELNLLSSFEISIGDSIIINNTNYMNQFKVTPNFSIEENNFKVNFNVEQSFKEYSNGEWIVNQYHQLTNKNPLNIYSLQLPTLNQLFDFMLQQVKVIDNSAYNFYPSYFMGVGLNSIKNEQPQTAIFDYLNINEVIEKYKNNYFPNEQYSFVINSNSNFSANDTLGTLSFSIYVKNFDNADIDEISASHQLDLSGFKTLNINAQQYNNYISVKNGSNLYNSLTKIFANEIQQVQNNKQLIENIEKPGLSLIFSNYFGLIYIENMETNFIDTIVNKVDANYKFSLFQNDILNFNTNISIDSLNSNNFNPSLGLYNLGSNSEDIIYLKSIEISLDANKNSISLDNNDHPEIRIFGNISITLANNEIINQNIVLVCKILKI